MELVDVTVYYLEMFSRPESSSTDSGNQLTVLHAEHPSVAYYRFLYNAVGTEYHWLSRRKLSDERLANLIQHPRDEMHVLYVDGSPAGFAELDCRQENEIELVQFGLLPEYIGKGWGKRFLQWTINHAWNQNPNRFWLHTCTLDHPGALSLYQSAGFQLYNEESIRREL